MSQTITLHLFLIVDKITQWIKINLFTVLFKTFKR